MSQLKQVLVWSNQFKSVLTGYTCHCLNRFQLILGLSLLNWLMPLVRRSLKSKRSGYRFQYLSRCQRILTYTRSIVQWDTSCLDTKSSSKVEQKGALYCCLPAFIHWCHTGAGLKIFIHLCHGSFGSCVQALQCIGAKIKRIHLFYLALYILLFG